MAAEQPGAVLAWESIQYIIHPGEKKEKYVLRGVSGAIAPKQVLAIMGPSGSGKTSLLNVLACRVPQQSKASLTGTVSLNGHDLTAHMPKLSAYVEQHEALFPLSTVRETLWFTAQLRLPAALSRAARAERVEAIVSELNLVDCVDTLVGSAKIRGLSGGERRRVTIGIELLNNPPICFMDEPTSGLDSFQAQAVMETLRSLANSGRTVVASIHQPRSSIYGMLDQVCLLASGRTVYFGAAGEVLASHFAKVGHPIPPSFNPADFIIDLVSRDNREPSAAKASAERVEGLIASWAATGAGPGITGGELAAGTALSREALLANLLEGHRGDTRERVGKSLVAFRLLSMRVLQELTRDKIALAIKYASNVFFAMLFGLVYFQMDRSQTSLQNRTGILFFTAMNMAFGVTIDTASVIPAQLAVVSRERAAAMYSIAPYYLANWINRLPLDVLPQLAFTSVQYFLAGLRPGAGHFFIFFSIISLEVQAAVGLGMLISALLPSVEAAPQLAPLAIILFLTFSGYFLNEDDIPDWIGWIKWISFIRYAFQALLLNEFKGASFECVYSDGTPATACLDGDTWLARLNFDDDSIPTCLAILAAIALGFNFLAYVVLVLRRPKFLKLATTASSSIRGGPPSDKPEDAVAQAPTQKQLALVSAS